MRAALFAAPGARLRCCTRGAWRMPLARSARAVAASAAAGSNRVVHVAHILLGEDQAALADEIEGRLAQGADFGELARQHSTCGSAKKGGELGWLNQGTFFPQFEKAAFATPVGGLARATTGRGLHLIKVLAERFQASIQQLPAVELAELLGTPAEVLAEEGGLQLVDVREEWEWETARLPRFELLPLSRFSEWGGEVSAGRRLDPGVRTVVLCHHGVRSMQTAQFLVSEAGFKDVWNVTGGIDAYSRVDSSVPIY